MSSQRERKREADRELERNRPIVYERDEARCVAGPHGCSGGLTLQHRRNRGMGGSNLLNGPQWLVTMCWAHNTRAESDPAFATLARALGWKLDAGEDPLTVAVFTCATDSRGWRLLDASGGYERTVGRDPVDRENWRGPGK